MPPPALSPPPAGADAVFAWLDVLEDLTYYELFGIPTEASPDEVQAAFHVFCDVFHPDRHLGRPAEERDAVSSIFKRGTEGYLVLSDLGVRDRYDAEIAAGRGTEGGGPPSAGPRSASGRPPPRLEDSVRSPSARPFARRAEELMQKGELKQAKLQLVMANHKDPANEELEAALRDLESRMSPPGDVK